MVADRKRVKQVLRNAERKKRRLKEKARALTDDDLLAVMRLREERKHFSNRQMMAARMRVYR